MPGHIEPGRDAVPPHALDDEPATRALLDALGRRASRRGLSAAACATRCSGAAKTPISTSPPRRSEESSRARQAGSRRVPTGLAHGTVTAVIPPRHFEITTLRRDVETDGRHARVAFDADWSEDAARRDFTINAIYLDPDGTLHDPVGGLADLAAHRVRFVGDRGPAHRRGRAAGAALLPLRGALRRSAPAMPRRAPPAAPRCRACRPCRPSGSRRNCCACWRSPTRSGRCA